MPRVGQHHGNNARNGGSNRHATNNSTGDITSRDRSTRNQACAGRFRSNGGAYLQNKVKSRLRAFKRGTLRWNRRVLQLVEEIDKASHRQFSLHSPDLHFDPSVTATVQSEQTFVDRLVDSLIEGGYGFVEGKKPADIVRLMGNNINNLSLYDESRSWKVDTICEINSRFQIDGMLLQECGTDFCQTPDAKSIGSLFGSVQVSRLGLQVCGC